MGSHLRAVWIKITALSERSSKILSDPTLFDNSILSSAVQYMIDDVY
ncbi:hypothetical protein [Methanobacterium congolense]|uniref:Uncharacterized protein n=1 Tax=Methanobacterium congolense TaxID=118062 RepID=A0A1D3KZA8_9EURY|nr:hypothetical protein [Methanobacterium congolense]SCG84712.1 hypothetical protein MCBB_0124 [Methanobacterium congolense]